MDVVAFLSFHKGENLATPEASERWVFTLMVRPEIEALTSIAIGKFPSFFLPLYGPRPLLDN